MIREARSQHPLFGHGDIDPIWILGGRCRDRGSGRGPKRGRPDWLSGGGGFQLLQIRDEAIEAIHGERIGSPLSRVPDRQRNEYGLPIGGVAFGSEIDGLGGGRCALVHGDELTFRLSDEVLNRLSESISAYLEVELSNIKRLCISVNVSL